MVLITQVPAVLLATKRSSAAYNVIWFRGRSRGRSRRRRTLHPFLFRWGLLDLFWFFGGISACEWPAEVSSGAGRGVALGVAALPPVRDEGAEAEALVFGVVLAAGAFVLPPAMEPHYIVMLMLPDEMPPRGDFILPGTLVLSSF